MRVVESERALCHVGCRVCEGIIPRGLLSL